MNRARTPASFGFPWNRRTERIIDFENPGCVSKRFQSSAIPSRHLLAGDAQELPDRNIQENGARFRQVVQIFNTMINLYFSAQHTKIIGERICNLLRTAAWNWPAHSMPRKSQDQTKCGADNRF